MPHHCKCDHKMYCVKCKKKITTKLKGTKTKKNIIIGNGKCPDCGSKTTKFFSKKSGAICKKDK